MKKVFFFLALAGTTFVTSCNSDDDNGTTTPVDPGTPVATSIVLTSDVPTVEVGGSFTFTVTDNLNADVTATSTLLVNNVEIVDNVFTPTEAGSYDVKAQNGTLESAVVTVTVTAVPEVPVAVNKVVYGSQSVDVTNSYLVFWGGYNEDETVTDATHGLWSLVVIDSNDPNTASTFVDVEFINPIVDGQLDFLNASNAIFNQIYEATLAGTEITIATQGSGTGTVEDFPEAINAPHAFAVSTTLNSTPFTINFDANWLGFINNSNGKPAAFNKSVNTLNANTKVISKAKLAQAKAKFFASLKK